MRIHRRAMIEPNSRRTHKQKTANASISHDTPLHTSPICIPRFRSYEYSQPSLIIESADKARLTSFTPICLFIVTVFSASLSGCFALFSAFSIVPAIVFGQPIKKTERKPLGGQGGKKSHEQKVTDKKKHDQRERKS